MPQPLVGRSVEQLRAYLEGLDPTTGRPFLQEVIEGLTGPLTDGDLKGATFERSTPHEWQPDLRAVAGIATRVFSQWLRGQLILGVTTG